MALTAILQTRMSSTRLPGKALRPAHGKPMTDYVLESLSACRSLSGVIAAISTHSSDDALEAYLKDRGVRFHRGPLEDVAARFGEAAAKFKLDAFVRISGDSPWMDPRVVDRLVELFEKSGEDVVTNVFRRSFPKGQSVEVFRAKTLLDSLPRLSDKSDREHVTPYFYRHATEYRIRNVECGEGDFSKRNLSVDTPEDFERFERVLGLVRDSGRVRTDFGWREILDLQDRLKTEANR